MNNLFVPGKEIVNPFSVKDMDAQTRRVKIMLSAFGNIDSDGDVIARGAFAKSIQERGPESAGNRKIKYLRYHDFEHQIGKFVSLEETPEGLVAVAELGRSDNGKNAFLDYQDGIITEHSIGFFELTDKIEFVNGARILKEVMLMEGSAVTFGANAETPVFAVSKSMNVKDQLTKLNKTMNGYIQALKNGQGTDERLEAIEMNLQVIQSKYNSLILAQPGKPTTPIDEPTKPFDYYDSLL